jgi:hypothetical protein
VGIPHWPRTTRRTGRRMRSIVSRTWAQGYGGDDGAGDKREMMTIGRLHDRRPADRLPPVGRFDEEVSDTTREPRGLPEADASPLACDWRGDFLSEPLKRYASLKEPRVLPE